MDTAKQVPELVEATPLQAAIAAAREPGTRQSTCLWNRLLQSLGLDADSLAVALMRHQGMDALPAPIPTGASVRRCTGATVEAVYLVEWPDRRLLVAQDPWSTVAQAALMQRQGTAIRLALTDAPGWQALQALAPASPDRASIAAPAPPRDAGPDSPVIRFVDQAIEHGHAEGASDIHFETDRQGLGVKYRLDGVMLPGPRMNDPQHAEEVISRIKVMAQLDITERRRPQDGRIRWSATPDGDGIDLRVSVMPSIVGEDAVLRLLDKSKLTQGQTKIGLAALGFADEATRTIRHLARRPHGMLLVTGPTGSGKTTTVYGALSEVNDGLGKIITIEDPVEYELPGVLQIPVNEQKGLGFATGLRSILRHDPDQILVGEIRDAETARIAVQSALTGHVVFTTVHANSMLDVLGRFEHFNIDPFSLASALNGVVVQRLLRRLCVHCLHWEAPEPGQWPATALPDVPIPSAVPSGGGCARCRHSGYRGRLVVAQVHVLDDRVRDLVIKRSSIAELRAVMHASGPRSLLRQSIDEVLAGHTSLEEVRRVVGWV